MDLVCYGRKIDVKSSEIHAGYVSTVMYVFLFILIYFPKVYILRELRFILLIFRDSICTSCTGLTAIYFAMSSEIHSYRKQAFLF